MIPNIHILNSITSFYVLAIGCQVEYTLGVGEKIIISSPNYPANYGNGENCLWIITGINGRLVDIDFKDFITENRYDQLKVKICSVVAMVTAMV